MLCCASVIPCCTSAVINSSSIAPPVAIALFMESFLPPHLLSVCPIFALFTGFAPRVGYPPLPPYLFRSRSFERCTSQRHRRNSCHSVAFPPELVYNATHAQGRFGSRHQ